jgi:8-oxo-dGTP pyrophosphatase MutT (NUDIX family)
MSKTGSTVAIIKDGKVLMTKREDFEVWCLPGGHTDPGESVAETAVREAHEEIGLKVKLTRFVGVYTRVGGEYTIHLNLFTANVIGGEINLQADEILAIDYFSPDKLPDNMFWWHRQQIADAVNGITGAAWRFEVVPAEIAHSRPELYALKAKSGLAPSEFYKYFFESNGTHRIEKLL